MCYNVVKGGVFMDLKFRKFLADHGISKEEFCSMTDSEKKKITNQFKAKEKAENLVKIGKGIQGVGALMMLLPILIVLIIILYAFISSMF
jgi:hypothetical protein